MIDQRLTLVRRLTENQENAIAASAGQLTTLSGERRALLAAKVRETLAQATTAQQLLHDEAERVRAGQEELAATEQRLAEAQQRHTELAAERDGRLARLAAHAQADTALAAALAAFRSGGSAAAGDPVGQLREALDGVAGELDQLDEALRDTVTADQVDTTRATSVSAGLNRRRAAAPERRTVTARSRVRPPVGRWSGPAHRPVRP